MDQRPIVVFYVPAGGGHRAAAQALEEEGRRRGLLIEAVDALSLAPAWFAQTYVKAHLLGSGELPHVYGGAFAASNHRDPLRDAFRRRLDRAVGHGLVAFVRARNPRAIVATHFYPLMELGRMRREGTLDVPLIGCVTDYVTHAVWCAEGVDLFCVARGKASSDARRHGVPARRIAETGIPIRAAFGHAPPFQRPERGQPLRVLVTSGGFGIGPVMSVLRSFTGEVDVEIDVVCGDRQSLVDRARDLVARRGLDAIVTGFARDMPDRVARAHVVVGKPGGLTMSEVLAAGRPLIAVGACPGQEEENEHALVSFGAGVASAASSVGTKIAALYDRGELDAMAEAARRNGAPRSAEAVLDAVLELVAQGSSMIAAA